MMKITNIKRYSNKTHTTLSAEVAFAGKKAENVYLRVANEYRNFVVSDATPFLAAALMPAMRKGEDIVIQGPVSPQLLTNTKKIMELVEGWRVGMNKIRIIAEKKKSEIRVSNLHEGAGCFFTGGVDSFYTFLKNREHITHFVLIHGCDIPLENKAFFAEALKSVQQIAKEVGVKVIVVETNMRTVIEPHLEWEWELGGALSSAALFLGNGLRKIHIPSGLRADQLAPYGTHPDLDPLFSTETTQIIHDGCEYSRLEKISESIAHSPLALKYLRVCCQIIKDKYNCNTCVKCEQTKMELLCANALDKAETLDKTIDLELVRKAIYNTDLNYHLFPQDILDSLRRQNREPELREAIAYSIQKSKHLPPLRRLANIVAYVDKHYLDRSIYKLVFGFTEANDRTLLYKFFSKMRLIS